MNGQQYKAEREALGLSQVRLAQLLGVTRHTIARRESGKSAVAAEAALAIGSAQVQAQRRLAGVFLALPAPAVDSAEPTAQQ